MKRLLVLFLGLNFCFWGCSATPDDDEQKTGEIDSVGDTATSSEVVSSDDSTDTDTTGDTDTTRDTEKSSCVLGAQVASECTQTTHEELVTRHEVLSLIHTQGPDAEYADLAVHQHSGEMSVAFLGKSSEDRVFIEIGHPSPATDSENHFDLAFVAYFADDGSSSLVGQQVVAGKSENATYAATLCNPDTRVCFLYEINLTGQQSDGLVPVENGEIPGWLGEKLTLLLIEQDDVDTVYVAGNGVARFDGSTWHEEIPPKAGLQFNGIDGAEIQNDTFVVVAGNNGVLTYRNKNGWTPVDTCTSETLTSVRASRNSTHVDVTGTGGVVLSGEIQSLSLFTVGSDSFKATAGNIGEGYLLPTLISANNTVMRFLPYACCGREEPSVPTDSGAAVGCRESQLPEDWVATENIWGGVASNLLHLSKTGCYAGPLEFAE